MTTRRVTVTDEYRKGLLGQGSILTLTSYANRTSPVNRGKYVLTNILGTPPPAPPPNVPPLDETVLGASVPMPINIILIKCTPQSVIKPPA